MDKNYRKGAKGALLDIYEAAIADLVMLIHKIPDKQLPVILDPLTSDENCRSFQSILTHVIHSGYGYAVSIHNLKGVPIVRPEKIGLQTISHYQEELSKLFTFTEKIFSQFEDSELEQPDNDLKIKSGWGQVYDIEQMTEHAIVHVLRHTRQIEKMLDLKINKIIH